MHVRLISCTSADQDEAEKELTKIKKEEAEQEVMLNIGMEELN